MSGRTRRLNRSNNGYNNGYNANTNNDSPDHTESLHRPLYPFLFMGCWNYTSPLERKALARNAVLDMIGAHKGDHLLIAAGDNAYPIKGPKNEKGKREKRFVMKDINEGFRRLEATGKQLLVGIGNHNADRTPTNGRSILNVEKDTFGPALPHPYFCRLFPTDKTALVFLDTNIFAEEDSHKLNALYEDPTYLTTMLDWLREVVSYLKRKRYAFYLVQHEPLFSIKSKENQRLNKGTHILDIFHRKRHFPIAVLSADTHSHQEWELTYRGHKYRQVVVGTGGATPNYVRALEDLPFNAKLKEDFEPFTSVRYKTADHNRTPSYGYLEIVEPLEHIFHSVGQEGFNFRTDE